MTRGGAEARPGEERIFLSTQQATAGQRRLALVAVGVSIAVFAALAPFAKVPLTPVPAFLPAYEAALVINDLITAVLLFGQYAILRWRALLVLSGAYLFSALMALAHALSFPGLFAQGGLLGAGPQTTAWIYFFWHGAFPLMIIGYALLAHEDSGAARRGAALAHAAGAIGAAVALVLLATAGHDLLPVIMQGNRDASTKVTVAALTWAFSLAALYTLWRRKPHTIVDLWLMVVMCAWIFDVALAAVLNGGRFDLGWYSGRIYGLAASSFVLVVLLLENGILYARLVAAHEREQAERRLVEKKTVELMELNKELDAFSYSVSHDLRAPLRAIDGYARMLEEDCAAALDSEGRRLLGVVRSSAHRMGQLIEDLLALSRTGRQEPSRVPLDMERLAREVAAELAAQQKEQRAAVEFSALPAARGDASLLRQVWINLIGNGMKYSGKSRQPRVEVGGREDGEENVYWVRDNGVGFDMRYAERLFGAFQRLHRPDEFPGTGIGLAIVHRVIKRHGGRVWAEAKPGEGACFYFALPREAGPLR
jgi:signal transduction histidine kinase